MFYLKRQHAKLSAVLTLTANLTHETVFADASGSCENIELLQRMVSDGDRVFVDSGKRCEHDILDDKFMVIVQYNITTLYFCSNKATSQKLPPSGSAALFQRHDERV